MYEGEWKQDKACGKGKFYHADGDICIILLFIYQMKENGQMIKLMVQDYIYILMELNMMVKYSY